jgi:hypothetical protein
MGPVPAVSQPVKKKSIAKRSPTRPRHGLLFLSPTSFLPLRDCSHRRREEATAPSSPPRWYVRLPSPPPPLPIIPSPAALRSDPIRSPASLPFPSSPHASTVESAESEGSYGTRPGCLLAWLGFERAQSPFRFSRPQSLSILSSLD